MKYHDRYPLARSLSEPVKGTVKADLLAPCYICGAATSWICIEFMARICSDECYEAAWKRLVDQAAPEPAPEVGDSKVVSSGLA